MSLYRFPTLTCDGCGEIYDPGQQMTGSEIRRWAKNAGWKYGSREDSYEREDLCLRCVHKPTCPGRDTCRHRAHDTLS